MSSLTHDFIKMYDNDHKRERSGGEEHRMGEGAGPIWGSEKGSRGCWMFSDWRDGEVAFNEVGRRCHAEGAAGIKALRRDGYLEWRNLEGRRRLACWSGVGGGMRGDWRSLVPFCISS